MSAARRAGLDLSEAAPHDLQATGSLPPLVVTVCDRAHEELGDRIRAVTALAS